VKWVIFYHDGDRYNLALVRISGDEHERMTTRAAHQLLLTMNVPPEHLQVFAVLDIDGCPLPMHAAVARGKVDQMLQIG
jgi:hypothetical protein